mgnify:CR=1 FL=1
MDIRMIAMDLDGTALQADRKTFSPRLNAALEAAHEKGIAIAPVTGRQYGLLPPAVTGHPVWENLVVTCNGGQVYRLGTGERLFGLDISEAALRQLVNEGLHVGEDITVVGGGCQNQLAVTEGIFNSLCHIIPCQVCNGDLGAALLFQLLSQQLYGLFGSGEWGANIGLPKKHLEELSKLAEESVFFFPEDTLTDQPERVIASELIREKLLYNLDKEIPHGLAVDIELFDEREDIINLSAVIYCERESHKGIIIGKQGAMLKKISSMARADCEKFMGTKVYLTTWVKVKENWRDSDFLVRNFGYSE